MVRKRDPLATGYATVTPTGDALGKALAADAWQWARPFVPKAAAKLNNALRSNAPKVEGGHRTGAMVHRRSLHRMHIDGRIFGRKTGSRVEPRGAVAVAIDDSGSMWSEVDMGPGGLRWESKHEERYINEHCRHGHARLMASLLLQAANRAGIDCGVYGHSTEGGRPGFALNPGSTTTKEGITYRWSVSGCDHAPSTVREYARMGERATAESMAGYLAPDGNDTWAHAAAGVRALLANGRYTHRILVVLSDGGFLGPPPGGWADWLDARVRQGIAVLPIALGGASARGILPGCVDVPNPADLTDKALGRLAVLLRQARAQ